MKLKGISPFEQHAEKIVLGVVAVVSVGLFVMQFDILGDPNAIELGGQKRPPEQVNTFVESEAKNKGRELQGAAPDGLPASIDVAARYVEALDGSAVPEGMRTLALAGAYDTSSRPTDAGPSPLSDLPLYVEVMPPAPSRPLVREWGGTVDPLVVAANPELQEVAGLQQQPYDLRGVTAEVEVLPSRIMAAFNAEPSEGRTRLPGNWLMSSAIVDPVLIRQEIGADGAIGAEEVIAPPPGLFSLRDEIDGGEFNAARLPEVLTMEAENRGSIRRQPLYPMIAGECFLPPSIAQSLVLTPEKRETRDKLLRELEVIRLDLERLQKQLDEMAWFEPRGPWPAVPRSASAQMGGDRPAPEPAEDAGPSREERKRQNIQKDQEQKLTRQKEVETALAAMGLDPLGQPLADPCSIVVEGGLEPIAQGSETPIKLWVHDITAEPGRTYRYRVEYRITNPFLGNANLLSDEQRPLAEKLTITSAPSEWSDPIRVLPEVAYFVTSANDGGEQQAGAGAQVGGSMSPRASVEAYRFYYGYWRKASANLSIGDTIRATATLPEGLVLPEYTLAPSESGAASWGGESKPLSSAIELASEAFLVDVSGVLAAGGTQAVFRTPTDALEVKAAEDGSVGVLGTLRDSHAVGLTAEILTPGGGRAPKAEESGGGQPSRGPAMPTRPAEPEPPPPATPGGSKPGRRI